MALSFCIIRAPHPYDDLPHMRGLLCARRDRPRHRAAEQRDELATLYTHSITSSARASSVGGTSRPSALAVVRLMTRSNLVDCSIGRSAGLVPRRILSTKSAARRNWLSQFGPYDISPPASTNSRTVCIVGSRRPSAKVLMRIRLVLASGSATT